MTTLDITNWIHRLRQAHVDSASLGDAQLLHELDRSNPERAFVALVARHGPLVLRVCRRLLNFHDAEDAFQATFLVLVRRAKSIRKGESLAAWLHGVAFRVATRMRADAFQRQRRERDVAVSEVTEHADISARELAMVLHREIERLPRMERMPLLLCYFEGLTQDAAARQLGWPRGTLKRRLERGRDRLRQLMCRRGLTFGILGPAMLDGIFVDSMSRVPALLGRKTVEACILAQAGNALPASLVSPSVVSTVQGVISSMTISKVRFLIAGLLCTLLTCGGFAIHSALGGGGSVRNGKEAVAEPRAEPRKQDESKSSSSAEASTEVKPDSQRILGTWRIVRGESQGIPLDAKAYAGIRLVFDAETVTWKSDQGGIPGGYKMDATKDPPEIDFAGGGRLPPYKGNYKFKGEKLLLALVPNGARPGSFVTTADTRFLVYELERVKADAPKELPAQQGPNEKAPPNRAPEYTGKIVKVTMPTEDEKKRGILATLTVRDKDTRFMVPITKDTRIFISKGKLGDVGTPKDLQIDDPVSIWVLKDEQGKEWIEQVMAFQKGEPDLPH
jgi:RNA polymerase sigma factor (sigma-70 family)